ncbi:MAG: hypothetical protein Ct9H300mP12_13970 [Acidimicrobiales bacterium]|nr:MAG: hypothetical protein Ct9H300mP12_13970 [Acidimicrobiales bacterium]
MRLRPADPDRLRRPPSHPSATGVSRVFTPKATRRGRTRPAVLPPNWLMGSSNEVVAIGLSRWPHHSLFGYSGHPRVPEEDADYLVELTDHLVEGTGDRPSLPDEPMAISRRFAFFRSKPS